MGGSFVAQSQEIVSLLGDRRPDQILQGLQLLSGLSQQQSSYENEDGDRRSPCRNFCAFVAASPQCVELFQVWGALDPLLASTLASAGLFPPSAVHVLPKEEVREAHNLLSAPLLDSFSLVLENPTLDSFSPLTVKCREALSQRLLTSGLRPLYRVCKVGVKFSRRNILTSVARLLAALASVSPSIASLVVESVNFGYPAVKELFRSVSCGLPTLQSALQEGDDLAELGVAGLSGTAAQEACKECRGHILRLFTTLLKTLDDPCCVMQLRHFRQGVVQSLHMDAVPDVAAVTQAIFLFFSDLSIPVTSKTSIAESFFVADLNRVLLVYTALLECSPPTHLLVPLKSTCLSIRSIFSHLLAPPFFTHLERGRDLLTALLAPAYHTPHLLAPYNEGLLDAIARLALQCPAVVRRSLSKAWETGWNQGAPAGLSCVTFRRARVLQLLSNIVGLTLQEASAAAAPALKRQDEGGRAAKVPATLSQYLHQVRLKYGVDANDVEAKVDACLRYVEEIKAENAIVSEALSLLSLGGSPFLTRPALTSLLLKGDLSLVFVIMEMIPQLCTTLDRIRSIQEDVAVRIVKDGVDKCLPELPTLLSAFCRLKDLTSRSETATKSVKGHCRSLSLLDDMRQDCALPFVDASTEHVTENVLMKDLAEDGDEDDLMLPTLEVKTSRSKHTQDNDFAMKARHFAVTDLLEPYRDPLCLFCASCRAIETYLKITSSLFESPKFDWTGRILGLAPSPGSGPKCNLAASRLVQLALKHEERVRRGSYGEASTSVHKYWIVWLAHVIELLTVSREAEIQSYCIDAITQLFQDSLLFQKDSELHVWMSELVKNPSLPHMAFVVYRNLTTNGDVFARAAENVASAMGLSAVPLSLFSIAFLFHWCAELPSPLKTRHLHLGGLPQSIASVEATDSLSYTALKGFVTVFRNLAGQSEEISRFLKSFAASRNPKVRHLGKSEQDLPNELSVKKLWKKISRPLPQTLNEAVGGDSAEVAAAEKTSSAEASFDLITTIESSKKSQPQCWWRGQWRRLCDGKGECPATLEMACTQMGESILAICTKMTDDSLKWSECELSLERLHTLCSYGSLSDATSSTIASLVAKLKDAAQGVVENGATPTADTTRAIISSTNSILLWSSRMDLGKSGARESRGKDKGYFRKRGKHAVESTSEEAVVLARQVVASKAFDDFLRDTFKTETDKGSDSKDVESLAFLLALLAIQSRRHDFTSCSAIPQGMVDTLKLRYRASLSVYDCCVLTLTDDLPEAQQSLRGSLLLRDFQDGGGNRSDWTRLDPHRVSATCQAWVCGAPRSGKDSVGEAVGVLLGERKRAHSLRHNVAPIELTPSAGHEAEADTSANIYDLRYLIPYLKGRLSCAWCLVQAEGEMPSPLQRWQARYLDAEGQWLRHVAARGPLQILIRALSFQDVGVRTCAAEALAVYSALLEQARAAAERHAAQSADKVARREQARLDKLERREKEILDAVKKRKQQNGERFNAADCSLGLVEEAELMNTSERKRARLPFREMTELMTLLRLIRNSFEEEAEETKLFYLPDYHSALAAALVPILMDPAHSLYLKVNQFLTSRPTLMSTHTQSPFPFYSSLYFDCKSTLHEQRGFAFEVVSQSFSIDSDDTEELTSSFVRSGVGPLMLSQASTESYDFVQSRVSSMSEGATLRVSFPRWECAIRCLLKATRGAAAQCVWLSTQLGLIEWIEMEVNKLGRNLGETHRQALTILASQMMDQYRAFNADTLKPEGPQKGDEAFQACLKKLEAERPCKSLHRIIENLKAHQP